MTSSSTSDRGDRRSQLGAGLLALIVVTLLIMRVSGAAFSATTSNTGSSFGVGSIALSDDAGAALFSVTDMAPGDSQTQCITVTYTGAFDPGVVKTYAGGVTDSANNLASHLNVTIVEGLLADTCLVFTGLGATIVDNETLTTYNADHADYANGFGTWDPAGTGEARAYEITIELDAGAPGTVQGESVSDVIFVWETQS